MKRQIVLSLLAATVTSAAHAVAVPAGDAPAASDLVAFDAESRGAELELRLTTSGDFGAPGVQVLVESDGNASTGLALDAAGFDYLIEGEQLYRFSGASPQDWQWAAVGAVTRSVKERVLRVRLDAGSFDSRQLGLVARTVSADYQLLDRAPQRGVMRVELKPVAAGTEAAGDADDGSRDIIGVAARQEGARVVLDVTTRETSKFLNTLVFLDRDGDDATGYRPTGSTHGFELLVNGDTLSEHSGDPAVWEWQSLGTVDRQVDANRMTLSLDASLLKAAANLRIGVWSMAEDWQTLVDRAPDRGLFELELDTAKIQASATPPVEVAPPKANRDLPVRERVAKAQNFYVYYGTGQVAALSHYDLVIAHSPQMKREDIAALKALGVVVVGYITVGEDDKLRKGDGTGPAGYASWYFDSDADGQPDQNPVWKSYFANANDPAWRADRVAEARRLVEEEGYDGIFLDTIDTVARFPEAEDGMVALIEAFRENLSQNVIILNQGYSLLSRLAPSADAFMLESFTATYDFNSQRYILNTPNSLDWHAHKVRQYVTPVLQKHPLKVLVLDYARPEDTASIQAAADRAATFGFLFAVAPIYLDRVYHTGIVGRPDPKWFERQATPERLSLELPESTNGFPMGSVILPSGSFGGYSVSPLVDGIEDRSTLHWSESAWASAEDGEAPWLEIRFPAPVRAESLEIRWATEGGHFMTSRRYEITARRDGAWRSVADVNTEAADSERTHHALPDEPIEALRIEQPVDGGHATRPNLMWIAQLRLNPRP